jgi:hypothetical protein
MTAGEKARDFWKSVPSRWVTLKFMLVPFLAEVSDANDCINRGSFQSLDRGAT